MNEWGYKPKGRHPHTRRGIKEVSNMCVGPLITSHNMQKPLRTYRCTEENGGHQGVYTSRGHMNIWGCINVGGI